MSKILLFIASFIYIIGFVPNVGIGVFSDVMPVISVLLILTGILSQCLTYPRSAKPFVRSIWLFGLFSVFISLPLEFLYYGASLELSTISNYIRPFRMLLTLYAGIFLYNIHMRIYGPKCTITLFKTIVLCLSINSLLIVLQSIFPQVYSITNQLFYVLIREVHFQVELRPGGFLYSGGAIPSAIAGLSLPLVAYLYSIGRMRTLTVLTLFVLGSLAAVFTGRTGILYILIFFVVLFVMLWKTSWWKAMLIFGVIVTLLFCSVLGYALLKDASQTSDSDIITSNAERLERLIEPQSFTQGALYGTIIKLLILFRLPQDPVTLLFGHMGFSVYEHSILSISDSGYNRAIWRYGLLGFVLYYLPAIIVIYHSLRHKITQRLGLICTILFGSYLVIEFKESCIYSRNLFNVFVLIAIVLYSDIDGWGYSEDSVLATPCEESFTGSTEINGNIKWSIR